MKWFIKPSPRNHHLSLGSKHERRVLSSLKDINLFSSRVNLDFVPVYFRFVQYANYPWLILSIDGFVKLKIDGQFKDVVIEIKQCQQFN